MPKVFKFRYTVTNLPPDKVIVFVENGELPMGEWQSGKEPNYLPSGMLTMTVPQWSAMIGMLLEADQIADPWLYTENGDNVWVFTQSEYEG